MALRLFTKLVTIDSTIYLNPCELMDWMIMCGGLKIKDE